MRFRRTRGVLPMASVTDDMHTGGTAGWDLIDMVLEPV